MRKPDTERISWGESFIKKHHYF